MDGERKRPPWSIDALSGSNGLSLMERINVAAFSEPDSALQLNTANQKCKHFLFSQVQDKTFPVGL